MRLEELTEDEARVAERLRDIIKDLLYHADKWMVLEVSDFMNMSDVEKREEVEGLIDNFFTGRYDSARDQRFISRHRAEIVKQLVAQLGK